MLATLAALLKSAATRASSVLLTFIGLVVLVTAAFYQGGVFWGLIATGVACFLLELRIDFEQREHLADEVDHG